MIKNDLKSSRSAVLGAADKSSRSTGFGGVMSRKRLLTALVVCAAISVPANAQDYYTGENLTE